MEKENIMTVDIEDFKKSQHILDYIDDDFAIVNSLDGIPYSNDTVRLNCFLIAVCVEGCIQLDINYRTYQLQAGDLLLGLPNTLISRTMLSPKYKIRLAGFSTRFLQRIIKMEKKTWNTAAMSVRMIGKMFTGDVSISNISGPVTIADYAGQTAQLGILPFISFLALVSISLGILNLLPIPMLDGGHLLYYSLEIVTGKPVSEAVQASAQKIGIAALFGLTILALFNDLTRLLP